MPTRREWIGLRLPSSEPVRNFKRLTGQLSRAEVDAMNEADRMVSPLVRVDGANKFRLGPGDGLSQWYEWSRRNGYTETLTDSDAAILDRSLERDQFTNPDDPQQAGRKPQYPSIEYLTALQMMHYGNQRRLSPRQLRKMRVLLRHQRGDVTMPLIGSRTMRYRP